MNEQTDIPPASPVVTGRPPASPYPVIRLTPALYEAAAARLVGPEAGDPAQAGRRLVRAAPAHGIDLGLMWGTVDAARGQVRQVCLVVLGAGRTAVLFLSRPPDVPDEGARLELTGAIDAACRFLAAERAAAVRIAQSLPDPRETWAIGALEQAGFKRVGDLAYMRRPIRRRRSEPQPVFPEGITVRPIAGIARGDPERARLAQALERSYEGTLDCPGLCGMRETEDVIDSHMATGRFDPSLWWLVMAGGEPHGCALFNPCPEQRTVELVYLGLSPALRGRGVAAALLAHGMARLGGHLSLTCAVDRRNAPALALYRRAGFTEFSSRVAMVRALGAA